MVNLNELNDNSNNNEEIVIFNNGNAGRVKNVRVEIKRKTVEDNPNSPDFKIFYIDDAGGKVNDGIYYPDDSGKGNPRFALSRLVQLLHAINPSLVGKELPQFEDYKTAVDFLMKNIADASKTGRVNVFVNYGTKGYPSQYLNVRKINFVEALNSDDSMTKLKPAINSDESKSIYNDLMARIEETNFDTEETSSSEEIDW